jgi:hypothetical protein
MTIIRQEFEIFKFFFHAIMLSKGGKNLNRSKTQFNVFPFFHVLRSD